MCVVELNPGGDREAVFLFRLDSKERVIRASTRGSYMPRVDLGSSRRGECRYCQTPRLGKIIQEYEVLSRLSGAILKIEHGPPHSSHPIGVRHSKSAAAS